MLEIDVYDIINRFNLGSYDSSGDIISYQYARNIYINNEGRICSGWDINVVKYFEEDTGRVQGAITYKYNGINYIIMVVDGNVIARRLPFGSDRVLVGNVSNRVDKVFFCKVGEFLVIQDGVNKPLLLLGDKNYTNHDIPIGTCMAFTCGRLFIKTGFNKIRASDMYLPYDIFNFSKFTEDKYLTGGGAIGLPYNMGGINGLYVANSFNYGSTEGGLFVFCDNGIMIFNVGISRTQWYTSNLAIPVFFGKNAISQDTIFRSGQNLLFLDNNGLTMLNFYKTDAGNLLQPFTFNNIANEFSKGYTGWTQRYGSIALQDKYLFYTNRAKKLHIASSDNIERSEIVFTSIVALDLSRIHREYNLPIIVSEIVTRDNITINKILDNGYMLGRKDGNLVLLKLSRDITPDTKSVIMLKGLALTKYGEGQLLASSSKRKLQYIILQLPFVRGTLNIELYGRRNGDRVWKMLGGKTINISETGTNMFGSDYGEVKITCNSNIEPARKIDLMIVLNGDFSLSDIIAAGRTVPPDYNTNFLLDKQGVKEYDLV